MADSIKEPSNPKTSETETETENAIFDNDDLQLVDSLTQRFSKQEEPEESDEPEEEVEDSQEDAEEVSEEVDSEEEDDSEEKDSEDDSEDDEFDEGKLYTRERFGKLVEKRIVRERKALQAEFNERFKELEQAKQEAETPTDALGQVKTTFDIKTLDKIEADAEKTIDFVEDNPDGFTLNEGKENERYIDRAELLEMKRNARQALKASKQRRGVIEQKNAFDAEVYKAFPQLKDKGSEEYVAVESVFNEIPALREHPKGTAFAIYLLKGEEVMSQPAPKKAKKKAEPKAPKLPDGNEPPKRTAAKQKKKGMDLKSIVEQGGDADALENALVAHLSQ
jgi:hypothetical protein